MPTLELDRPASPEPASSGNFTAGAGERPVELVPDAALEARRAQLAATADLGEVALGTEATTEPIPSIKELEKEALDELFRDTDAKKYMGVAEEITGRIEEEPYASLAKLELVRTYSGLVEPDKAQSIIDSIDPAATVEVKDFDKAGNTVVDEFDRPQTRSVSTRDLALHMVTHISGKGPVADRASVQLSKGAKKSPESLQEAYVSWIDMRSGQMKDGKVDRFERSAGFVPINRMEQYQSQGTPEETLALMQADAANLERSRNPDSFKLNAVRAVSEEAYAHQLKVWAETPQAAPIQ